jgi:Chaperone of endosialidase
MFRARVLLSLAAVLCVSNGLAEDELIKNWEAPAFWRPVRAVDPTDSGVRTEAAAATMATYPVPFIGITPCRLLDTRNNLNPLGGGGPFAANEVRTYSPLGACGLPNHPGVEALSLNVTATNTGSGAFGHIKIWPADQPEPNVSTVNYPGTGATVANAAIATLSGILALKVKSGNASADIILDVNGYYSGSSTADLTNVFLGPAAGNSTMTGVYNIGLGSGPLPSNTSGSYNTAVGFALNQNTTGSRNTAIGDKTLEANHAGSGNTAVGSGALNGFTGDNNSAFGVDALRNSAGSNNIAMGLNALRNGAGSNNIAIGLNAGTVLTSGSNNIYIGNAGASAGETGQIRIGDNAVHTQGTVIASIYGFGATGGAPVYVTSGGRLGTSTASSRRYKEEIHDIAAESDALLALRPVAFRYREEFDPARLPQYGLIAEEVAEVFPELVVCDREGRPESVRYHELSALLLNEIQKQHRSIESQRAEIKSLEARLAKLEASLKGTRER